MVGGATAVMGGAMALGGATALGGARALGGEAPGRPQQLNPLTVEVAAREEMRRTLADSAERGWWEEHSWSAF